MGCGAAFTPNFLYSEYVLRLQGAACAPDGGTARIGASRRDGICNTVCAPDVEAVRIDGSTEEAKLWYGLHAEHGGTGRVRPLPRAVGRSARFRRLWPDRACVFCVFFAMRFAARRFSALPKIFPSVFLLSLLTTDDQACILCISNIYRKGAPPVDVIVSNASAQPIYEQIYSQIKAQILSGALREGELLPSIRALAKDLRISVITTKRAYDELEKDGYIYTVAGKGCYVAERNEQLVREEYLKQIEAHMQAIVENAAACGIRGEAAARAAADAAGNDGRGGFAMNAIEIKGLRKQYGGFTLGGLDFTLPEGCITGLVGENGAGKSTLLRLIVGMTRPDAGELRVLGAPGGRRSVRALREDIGYVPTRPISPRCSRRATSAPCCPARIPAGTHPRTRRCSSASRCRPQAGARAVARDEDEAVAGGGAGTPAAAARTRRGDRRAGPGRARRDSGPPQRLHPRRDAYGAAVVAHPIGFGKNLRLRRVPAERAAAVLRGKGPPDRVLRRRPPARAGNRRAAGERRPRPPPERPCRRAARPPATRCRAGFTAGRTTLEEIVLLLSASAETKGEIV